jgi:glycosyltransferase involved in cell wall biosynthesis
MIKRARGDLIARMDADDIAYPERLEKQVKFFQHQPETDVVFGNTTLIDKDGREVCQPWRPDEDTILRVLPVHCYISHPTVMIRRSTLEAVGGYNEEYWTGQDKELWIRMLEEGASFRYMPDRILHYRINPNSVRKYVSDDYYFELANKCIWNGQKSSALKYFKKLTLKKKLLIFVKLAIPRKLYFLRQTDDRFKIFDGLWS